MTSIILQIFSFLLFTGLFGGLILALLYGFSRMNKKAESNPASVVPYKMHKL